MQLKTLSNSAPMFSESLKNLVAPPSENAGKVLESLPRVIISVGIVTPPHLLLNTMLPCTLFPITR